MKKVQRLLSVLLVCCLAIGLLPSEVLAANTPTSGACGEKLTWTLENGTLTISGSGEMDNYDFIYEEAPWYDYKDSFTAVEIEYGVTSIGYHAFSYCRNLTSVNIPASMIRIGEHAFNDCTSLTSVAIPNSVTSIEDYAFANCSALTSFIIPGSVASIENWSFSGCSSLTSVTISHGVTKIERNVFDSCRSLTSVIIPESVTSLEAFAFQDCDNLTSIAIPNNVTDIPNYAFNRCRGLTDVYYSGSKAEWNAIYISRNGNDALASATIHYNSTGPNEESGDDENNVTDILSIFPENNLYYARVNGLQIDFDSNVEIGSGKIRLKDLSTHATIQEIDIDNPACVLHFDEEPNVIHLANLFGNKEPFGPRNQSFYLEFESGALVNAQTGKSYGAISTEKMWHMNTLPVQTWGFENPTSEIGAEIYFRVFPAQYALAIKNWDHMFKNDGQKGHCYGMASTAGSITMGFPTFPSFTSEDSWSLSTASENSQGTQILGKTAQEFIDIGHVMQMLPARLLEKTFNTNLGKLCVAVKTFQERNGEPVVISLKGSDGGHAILASGIRETENECEIIAYDPNVPSCIVVIKLEKENGKYTRWQVSCPDNELYTNDTLANLNEKISYSIPGKDAYVQLLTTEPASIVGYNLLQSMMKDFDIANRDGESANVVAGEVGRITANEFLIPIQTDNGLSNVQSANMQLLSWVSDQSPICIKGIDSAISETSLIGNDSDVKIATNADTEITLSLSAWEEGGNQIQLDLKSPNPVVVSNHYVNYPVSGKTKEYSLQIEGNANSWMTVSESAYGTKVQGLTNADITAKLDNAERKFNIETLVDTNAVYISLKDVDDAVIVEINADTTGDGLPDVILNRGLLSGSLQTTYTVAFDANGGTLNNPQFMITEENGALIELPTPTRGGYTFVGWYTAPTGGEQITTETVFSEDTTVYAHWTKNPEATTFTIVLNANGGTVDPTSIATGEDGTLSALPTPVRTNYTFDGWYTAITGGTKATTDTVFSSDTTIYAHWSWAGGGSSSGTGSGGGSGGGYVPTTNPITVPVTDGGTVTVSPTTASNGGTVTITTVPDDGYELLSLVVADKSGKEIALTDKGNGIFTFTMPNSQVSINAVFQKIGAAWNNPFTDVTEGTWYYDAVKFANESGLMNGIGNSLLAPNANLSRAMMAQILYNNEGTPSVNNGSVFADVASDVWYTDAIAWVAEKGIVNGYGNGLFGPNDDITREELAAMLWRYAGEPAATDKELHFSDADKASGYALEALYWAVENGIINGKGGGILDPTGQATRAETAQMLKNFLEK